MNVGFAGKVFADMEPLLSQCLLNLIGGVQYLPILGERTVQIPITDAHKVIFTDELELCQNAPGILEPDLMIDPPSCTDCP